MLNNKIKFVFNKYVHFKLNVGAKKFTFMLETSFKDKYNFVISLKFILEDKIVIKDTI